MFIKSRLCFRTSDLPRQSLPPSWRTLELHPLLGSNGVLKQLNRGSEAALKGKYKGHIYICL
eukprot:1196393-Prorocentrum_minimum.AAC.4